MNFISTTVLKSDDGVSFSKEEAIDSEAARRAAEKNAAPSRSLYEQLAEREQEKKDEFDRVAKAINAPPRALDEEDVEHLEAIAERKRAVEVRRSQEDQAAVEAFAEAQKRSLTASEGKGVAQDALQPPGDGALRPTARKAAPSKGSMVIKVKKRKGGSPGAPKAGKRAKAEPEALLVDYGNSDSDEAGEE